MQNTPSPRTVNVGVIGLGTVGGGTVKVLTEHHDEYLCAYGVDVRVARGCSLDEAAAAELDLYGDAFTSDWHDITSDPAIDIVVELIGGKHPATEIFMDAFAHGKHVVSANKALLGMEIENLANAARKAGVQLRCEASCGGGIPIIDALERGLSGNTMLALAGIVNGTTNYILSRMDAEGLGFDEVLADAQRLGFAEADPTADVDGLDAAAKLAILSSLAFHTRVTSNEVFTQGIRQVGAADIAWARAHNMCIKLLAVGRNTKEGIEARVHPALIPANHMLAGVNGAMNAVYAVGDAVGETMFYGAGAGSLPTASAVVSDILALATPLSHGRNLPAQAKPYTHSTPVLDMDSHKTCFYMRAALATAANAEQTEQELEQTFGQLDFHPVTFEIAQDELMLSTDCMSEAAFTKLTQQLEQCPGIASIKSVIRIEDTDAWSKA